MGHLGSHGHFLEALMRVFYCHQPYQETNPNWIENKYNIPNPFCVIPSPIQIFLVEIDNRPQITFTVKNLP